MTGIRELARHLDISIGTVSRALNGKADVNPETRERVREAAAKLGYSPNQSGRSLRRGRTDLVGVIVPTAGKQTLINPVFLAVLDGLRRYLSEHRLDLAVFLHGPDEDTFGSLRRLTERGLFDGLIISDTQSTDPRIDYLIRRGAPFVAFGRSLSGGGHAWVDPDFVGAVEAAIDLLVEAGHRRIGLMLPVGEVNYLNLIQKAYESAMARRGMALEAGWLRRLAAGEHGGREAAEAFLVLPGRPTAILVSEAMQVVGLYRKLDECGLRPGRDISLVGVMPEARAQIVSPALTTFQTDWSGIGERLGEALVREIARPARSRRSPRNEGGAPREPQAIQSIMPVVLQPGASVHLVAE